MLTSESHLSCHFQPSVVTLALSRPATTTSSQMISTNLALTSIASSS